ncbi:MAG: hypothetical protein ACKVOR_09350 [Flavobacteriales bacterium]
MFEHKSQQLISRKAFINRQLKCTLYALLIICISLAIGVMGYSVSCQLSFIDALLNASMILTGMGPVDKVTTNSGKLFASFYAIYSGVAFLSTIGVFIAPILHRFMHKHHLES